MDVRQSVLDRYSEGAQQRVEALCCPVDDDAHLLEAIPDEILERDYGCGDPSRYVREGDTVPDLGTGEPCTSPLAPTCDSEGSCCC